MAMALWMGVSSERTAMRKWLYSSCSSLMLLRRSSAALQAAICPCARTVPAAVCGCHATNEMRSSSFKSAGAAGMRCESQNE